MNIDVIAKQLSGKLNESVETLEQAMLQYPQLDLPVKEQLKDGLYTRELFIPAGTILTGRVWLSDYVDIMISGHIIVATAAGVKELTGYNVLDGKAGRKRAGYAVADTVWVTVHKTEAKDTVGLLENLSVFSMREYKVIAAQLSYVKQFGEFEEAIQQQVQVTTDLVKLPPMFNNVEVRESDISGLGLFATREHKTGEHIAPARLNEFRTCAGRYTNHSCFPNAVMVKIDSHVALVATTDIKAGEEILIDYLQTVLHMEGVCPE